MLKVNVQDFSDFFTNNESVDFEAEVEILPLERGFEFLRTPTIYEPHASILRTSGFATTHVVVSVRQPITN